jgi:hypothetical protein
VDLEKAETARRANEQTRPAREITTAATREKQITAPIASATITVLYSISLPVLNVLSQRSKSSETWPQMHRVRTIAVPKWRRRGRTFVGCHFGMFA